MVNNKFNKLYSKKTVSDLLKQLLSHKNSESILELEWHDALLIHLSERELHEDSRIIFEKIMNSEPETLKLEKQKILIDINNLSEIAIKSSSIRLKKSGINAAGKSLKNIVYTAIILIFCAIGGIFVSVTSNDSETIKNIYIFLGFVSLICNLIILNSLYSAGDILENS